MKPRFFLSLFGLIALGLLSIGRGAIALSAPGDPGVVITSVGATQFYVGQRVSVKSTSTDPSGIARVDLLVDRTVVASVVRPTPAATFTVVQTWKATAGSHMLSVRSYNTAYQASDSAPVPISVLLLPSRAAAPSGMPYVPIFPGGAGTIVPFGLCANNAEFVADVTIPAGSVANPGQMFVKTWRVRNIGTCIWDNTFLLAFMGSEAMSPWIAFMVPTTLPGAMLDLPIELVAPTAPGVHTGFWQLVDPNGVPFGPMLSVFIQVPGAVPPPAILPPVPPATATATPAGCSGTPNIQFFNVVPDVINAGDSATLSWGFVSNAASAVIGPGIGGVATPGSITITPSTTTTYTLVATCGPNWVSAQVTITVNPHPANTPTRTPGLITPIPPGPHTPTPHIEPL